MSTQEVALKLVDLCRQGRNMEAIQQLYADDVVSTEMPGAPNESVSGIKAVFKKSEDWFAGVAEFHGGTVSDPQVVGDHFSTKMTMDITFKDGNRVQMEELAVYGVKDGKIASEQFFYTVP